VWAVQPACRHNCMRSHPTPACRRGIRGGNTQRHESDKPVPAVSLIGLGNAGPHDAPGCAEPPPATREWVASVARPHLELPAGPAHNSTGPAGGRSSARAQRSQTRDAQPHRHDLTPLHWCRLTGPAPSAAHLFAPPNIPRTSHRSIKRACRGLALPRMLGTDRHGRSSDSAPRRLRTPHRSASNTLCLCDSEQPTLTGLVPGLVHESSRLTWHASLPMRTYGALPLSGLPVSPGPVDRCPCSLLYSS
jgi:hypothetical protein